MDLLSHAAKLTRVLRDLERSSGISNFSDVQKSILYAIEDMTSRRQDTEMEKIIAHPFLSGLSRTTIYRAAAVLSDAGLIHKEHRRSQYYIVEKSG